MCFSYSSTGPLGLGGDQEREETDTMAPFPPTSATIPMSAKDYLMERDNAAYRVLVAEVCLSCIAASLAHLIHELCQNLPCSMAALMYIAQRSMQRMCADLERTFVHAMPGHGFGRA